MKEINDDKKSIIQDILGIKTEMGVEQLRACCEAVQLFDTESDGLRLHQHRCMR